MKSKVLDIMNSHKAIRKFKNESISCELQNILEESFVLSPTAQGMQACSMIRIEDAGIKEELAKISGQAYTKDAPLIYIFIVDYHKIVSVKNDEVKSLGLNHLLSATVDAMIGAQTVYLAAEELGLSGFYSASILKDVKKLIDLLNLPKFTYPVIGLCLGYKDEEAMKKPRLDKKYRVYENTYKEYENYEKEFMVYDEILNQYIDNRKPNETVGKYTDIIKNKYSFSKQDLEIIKKQGFE